MADYTQQGAVYGAASALQAPSTIVNSPAIFKGTSQPPQEIESSASIVQQIGKIASELRHRTRQLADVVGGQEPDDVAKQTSTPITLIEMLLDIRSCVYSADYHLGRLGKYLGA